MMGMVTLSVGIWIGVLSGPDSPTREAALDSLVASGQTQPLVQAVFDNGWRTRDGLIVVLERMGAVPALIDIATQHDKVDAQRLAIRSLGRVGGRKAQVALRGLLQAEHRDLAVEALGLVGDVSDIKRIRPLLKDKRADVRRRAALALLHLGGPEEIGEVVGLLGDPHHSVRFAVYGALVPFQKRSVTAVLLVYEALPLVGKQLSLRLFGQVRDESARVVVEDALMGEAWPIQLSAVQAIDAWQSREWLPVLKKAQKEVSSPIVFRAIEDVIKHWQ